ncbi:hypothetical protein RP20_CCG004410 [Aedes albopictus]|nr:hypothetical protein RP20_CCG004410 [Aedes albopictus]
MIAKEMANEGVELSVNQSEYAAQEPHLDAADIWIVSFVNAFRNTDTWPRNINVVVSKLCYLLWSLATLIMRKSLPIAESGEETEKA